LDIKERMQAVFQAEAAAINAIEVDADFIHAVEVMMACRGKILTTGIGKAGHIAKEIRSHPMLNGDSRRLYSSRRGCSR
jgi:D-arabinose 5-phosphate isomerase GutQ